jgi:hypothetical protein
MENALYEEKQTFALRNLIIVVAVVIAVMGVWLGTRMTAHDVGIGALCLTWAVIIFWGFSSMKVMVTPTMLRFGFPFYMKRVPLDKLKVGEIAPLSFWYGMGIHYIRGMWVWNARLGHGVRIDVGRTKYLIGSDHPERLQAALMERTRQRVPQ